MRVTGRRQSPLETRWRRPRTSLTTYDPAAMATTRSSSGGVQRAALDPADSVLQLRVLGGAHQRRRQPRVPDDQPVAQLGGAFQAQLGGQRPQATRPLQIVHVLAASRQATARIAGVLVAALQRYASQRASRQNADTDTARASLDHRVQQLLEIVGAAALHLPASGRVDSVDVGLDAVEQARGNDLVQRGCVAEAGDPDQAGQASLADLRQPLSDRPEHVLHRERTLVAGHVHAHAVVQVEEVHAVVPEPLEARFQLLTDRVGGVRQLLWLQAELGADDDIGLQLREQRPDGLLGAAVAVRRLRCQSS